MCARAALVASAVLLLLPAAARADATFFIGSSTSPTRTARGLAVGAGLLIVAFEFEYASTKGDEADASPSLRTGMGNVLLQTPVAIGGVQPYLTTGGGLYRERLGDRSETSVAANAGGGVKISVAGPLRLRVDYRVFTLRGDPLHARVQRVYAGANLRF